MKAKFYFAWFDFWTGWYYDRADKILYLQLVPMFGLKIWCEDGYVKKAKEVMIPEALKAKRDQLLKEIEEALDDPELRVRAEAFHKEISSLTPADLLRPFDCAKEGYVKTYRVQYQRDRDYSHVDLVTADFMSICTTGSLRFFGAPEGLTEECPLIAGYSAPTNWAFREATEEEIAEWKTKSVKPF